MIKKCFAGIATVALIAGLQPMSCQANDGNAGEKLYQISTIQALTAGDYYGSFTVEELLEHGDIGLGTFDKLNGEMIVLDGVCYRAAGDGTVEKVDSKERVPFASVTWLDEDDVVEFHDVTSLTDLKAKLDKRIKELGANNFFAARIDGKFNKMYVRSELAQNEPYKTLDKVLETDQTEFKYESVSGTLVAIYCPDYVSGVNAVGWHLHFVSDDRTKGGHVMDLQADRVNAVIDRTTEFDMRLPYGDYFKNLELTKVSKESVDKVEMGK